MSSSHVHHLFLLLEDARPLRTSSSPSALRLPLHHLQKKIRGAGLRGKIAPRGSSRVPLLSRHNILSPLPCRPVQSPPSGLVRSWFADTWQSNFFSKCDGRRSLLKGLRGWMTSLSPCSRASRRKQDQGFVQKKALPRTPHTRQAGDRKFFDVRRSKKREERARVATRGSCSLGKTERCGHQI